MQANWALDGRRGRGRLGAERPPTNPAGRTPSSAMPTLPTTSAARSSAWDIRCCAASACSCTGRNPQYRFAAQPDLMTIRRFREIRARSPTTAGVRPAGLPGQMARRAACRGQSRDHLRPAACRHARGPVAGGPAAWREGMQRSRRSRTSSRSCPASAPSSTATTRRTSPGSSAETVELFGARRCLFGSNFPIEKLWTDYAADRGAPRRGLPGMARPRRTSSGTRPRRSIGRRRREPVVDVRPDPHFATMVSAVEQAWKGEHDFAGIMLHLEGSQDRGSTWRWRSGPGLR